MIIAASAVKEMLCYGKKIVTQFALSGSTRVFYISELCFELPKDSVLSLFHLLMLADYHILPELCNCVHIHQN